jgi:hypothetical protein
MNTVKNSIIKLIQQYSHSTKKIFSHKTSILPFLQDAAESQPLRSIQMEFKFKLKLSGLGLEKYKKSPEINKSNKAHESH